MPTGLTIRPLDGPPITLVVDDHGHFADPGEVAATEEIASEGWYALPGLADCHAHLSGGEVGSRVPPDELDAFVAQSCWAQLQGGVFLVADKGTHDNQTLRILDAPPTERPDLHMAGRVIAAPGGYYGDFGWEVDPADLSKAVAEVAATRGTSWVKLIGDWPRKGVGAVPNFEEAALSQAAQVAHEGGCRIAIHACAPRTSTMAVAAGFDSIEHGLFLSAADVEALGRTGRSVGADHRRHGGHPRHARPHLLGREAVRRRPRQRAWSCWPPPRRLAWPSWPAPISTSPMARSPRRR